MCIKETADELSVALEFCQIYRELFYKNIIIWRGKRAEWWRKFQKYAWIFLFISFLPRHGGFYIIPTNIAAFK